MLCVLLISTTLYAQQITWDDTSRQAWPTDFRVVDISSSADGSTQKAYFYAAESVKPQPLIVSLHTWSGDYTQKDPLVAEILARGYNYIHPDFRGPNNHPAATVSPLVVSDIEDAIRYALENSHSDPNDVHIIGVSGGGLATLAAYMNVRHPVRSFSAWAPISDLEAWYWESVGRKQKYAGDIRNSVGGEDQFDAAEARRRSPLFQDFPRELRAGAELYIYEGIHDGYTGSVPITHAIHMYNRLVSEQGGEPVSDAEMLDLVTKRYNPNHDPVQTIEERAIYLQRDHDNLHLTIFEGGHEQLPRALSVIPTVSRESDLKRNIFTIGDSNGANPGGWVDQLRAVMPQSDIFNISRGGRTIGFDNNGSEDLNALRNIDSYMTRAAEHIGRNRYDYIILCLGTNDTKAEFADLQDAVVRNFEALLDKMLKNRLNRTSRPKLIFVTPPPMGVEDMLPKYMGGNDRLGALVPQWTRIAQEKGFFVVDVYHPLLPFYRIYAPDGVHMVPEGQQIIAAKILEQIEALEQRGK